MTPERLPDDLLLAGLGTGDSQAAQEFVRRFQRTVFGVALTVVGERGLAEDIAQQAFERAWRHAALYDPRRGSVRTWLTRIAHNLAVDAVRVRRPEPIDPKELQSLIDVITDTPEHRALAAEALTEIRSVLATFPPEQARALVMAGVHGLTAQEIAEVEHIPLGTAKSRIRAAMAKLHSAVPPRVLPLRVIPPRVIPPRVIPPRVIRTRVMRTRALPTPRAHHD
jgi:RNA polymerase sigma factor (sigma-70 family)